MFTSGLLHLSQDGAEESDLGDLNLDAAEGDESGGIYVWGWAIASSEWQHIICLAMLYL